MNLVALMGSLTLVGLSPDCLTRFASAQPAPLNEPQAETPPSGEEGVEPLVEGAFEVELSSDVPQPLTTGGLVRLETTQPGDLPPGETIDVRLDPSRMATVARARTGVYSIRLVTQAEGQADKVEELTADGTTDFQDRFAEVARAVRREQLRKFLMNRAAGNARQNGMRTMLRREGARITVDVQQGTEHILMTQVDGQVIKVRRQWTEQGDPREEEFEAADLPALRKVNPRIAEIFEKQTTPNPEVPVEMPVGNVIGGLRNPPRNLPGKNVPINRFPLNGPFNRPILIGGNPIGGIGGVVEGVSATNSPRGPRTIRARYRGAQLQIEDVDGGSIRISLIPDDPAEALRAAEAADFPELLQKSPLLAELYTRYTGTDLPAAEE